MVKNRKNLKFLSQSVLLEEEGFPRINSIIILVIFAIVVSFIVWSISMKIDEVVTVGGSLVQKESTKMKFSISIQIPTKEISTIKVGDSVNVSISGVTDKNPIVGTIEQINKIPKTSELGVVYYEGFVIPTNSEEIKDIEKILIPGMETSAKIVVGSRSLFEYFLGSVMNAKENAFKEK